jgi:hypothetical protein
MKKVLLVFSIIMVSVSLPHAHAQMRVDMEVISGNRPPNPDEARRMRAEEEGHPNIAQAMHKIEEAMNALKMAPDNFGGHKGAAMEDLRKAYISLRKALYFRLYEEHQDHR